MTSTETTIYNLGPQREGRTVLFPHLRPEAAFRAELDTTIAAIQHELPQFLADREEGTATKEQTDKSPAYRLLQTAERIAFITEHPDLQYSLWTDERDARPEIYSVDNMQQALMNNAIRNWNGRKRGDFFGKIHAQEVIPKTALHAIGMLLESRLEGFSLEKALQSMTGDDYSKFESPISPTVMLSLDLWHDNPNRRFKPSLSMKQGYTEFGFRIVDTDGAFTVREYEALKEVETAKTRKNLRPETIVDLLEYHDPNVDAEKPAHFNLYPNHLTLEEIIALFEQAQGDRFTKGEITHLKQNDTQLIYTPQDETGEYALAFHWSDNKKVVSVEIVPTEQYQEKRKQELKTKVTRRMPEALLAALSRSSSDKPFVYLASNDPTLIMPDVKPKRLTKTSFDASVYYPAHLVREAGAALLPLPEAVSEHAQAYARGEVLFTGHSTSVHTIHGETINLRWKLEQGGYDKGNPFAKIVCWIYDPAESVTVFPKKS